MTMKTWETRPRNAAVLEQITLIEQATRAMPRYATHRITVSSRAEMKPPMQYRHLDKQFQRQRRNLQGPVFLCRSKTQHFAQSQVEVNRGYPCIRSPATSSLHFSFEFAVFRQFTLALSRRLRITRNLPHPTALHSGVELFPCCTQRP